MKLKAFSLYTVRLALCFIFSYSFIMKLIEFSKGETGTKVYKKEVQNGIQNLSMTICPTRGHDDISDVTLEDISRIKDVFTMSHFLNNGKKREDIDLGQAKEFLYLWEWGNEWALSMCLDVELLSFKPGDSGIIIYYNKSWAEQLTIGFYPNGKSPFLTAIHYDEVALIPIDGLQRAFGLVHKISNYISDSCDMENNQYPLHCAMENLESRANCYFPWEQKRKKPLCTLENLKNEYSQFKKDNLCLAKNCKYEYLKPEMIKQKGGSSLIEEHTTLIYFTQFSKEADVIDEYYLMDFSDFVSAVGGDLGIFIGAGLLTLFEGIIEIFSRRSWRVLSPTMKTQINHNNVP